MTVIAVLTNLPDSESAFNLARERVHLRSTHERYMELEGAIRKLHPYTLPEAETRA